MRKLAVTLALASTALASPALARDKSWYVGVEGGAQIVEDINYDIGSSALVPPAGSTIPAANNAGVTHHYGYDVDGVIGYDFGHFRAEAEVGYRRSNISGLNYATPTYVAGAAASTGVDGSYQNVPWAGGATSALSFMVNGLLDFGPDNGLQGFIGGGVGVAQIKANYGVGYAAGDAINDSDTVFAWQVLAGIRAPINKHVDFSLKYRFFNADDVVLYDTNGSDWHGRYRSHSILGGIIFNFGEPAAPPPPPPPPPPVPTPTPTPQPYVPPAPTPQTVCTPGPYIVFFGWNKSDITPDAASILDNAIANYQNCSNTSIMIAGYTDTSGTPKYNLGLSDRRADAVKAYFAGKGIAPGVITTHGFGETNLRVQTADGVREPQNRRVEINYGPGASN